MSLKSLVSKCIVHFNMVCKHYQSILTKPAFISSTQQKKERLFETRDQFAWGTSMAMWIGTKKVVYINFHFLVWKNQFKTLCIPKNKMFDLNVKLKQIEGTNKLLSNLKKICVIKLVFCHNFFFFQFKIPNAFFNHLNTLFFKFI